MKIQYSLSLFSLLITFGYSLTTSLAIANSHQPEQSFTSQSVHIANRNLASSAVKDNSNQPNPARIDLDYIRTNFRFDSLVPGIVSSGLSGRNGPNQTVFADGSKYEFDLSGQPGSSASSPGYPGNNGGNGGNGGNLTIYYSNLDYLSQIYVDASGGRGGSGRRNLSCNRSSPISSDSLQRAVESALEESGVTERQPSEAARDSDRYQSGHPGFSNSFPNSTQHSTSSTCRSGSRGSDGNPGQLRIINRQERLPLENNGVEVSLSNLLNRTFNLSKHIWHERSGAADLLAPGSIIADEYLEFVDLIESTVQVSWDVPQPIETFANRQASLHLQDNGSVSIDLEGDFWSLTETRQQDGVTEVALTTLIPANEVTDLAIGQLIHEDNALNLYIIDRAGLTDSLETTFQLRYTATTPQSRYETRPSWRTHYSDDVPKEVVSRDRNRFVLNLDQLPIEAQYLRPGTYINIKLDITRSLGERSATQTLTWQGEIY